MSVHLTPRTSAERLVVAATMGPTIHNVHAWRLRAAPGRIEVHADPYRFRRMDDPSGRGLHLSCGAALVNLRLAAGQIGHEAIVRLLPDEHRPTLLASVRLAGHQRISRAERLLYAATLRPIPARRADSDEPPSRPVLNDLAAAARLEGASFYDLPGDGVHTALLTTPGDSPIEWLRGGQALQRVLLTAAVRAVSASFLYEIVDVPGVQGLIHQGDVPQVLLRLATPPLAPRAVDRDMHGQRDRDRVG